VFTGKYSNVKKVLTAHKPLRINKQQGIVEAVSIEIDTITKWISSQVPAWGGVVMAVQVVVQIGLRIIILSWEAEIVYYRLYLYLAPTKRIVDGRPYHRSTGGNYLLRGTEMVIPIPVVNPSYPDKERISGPTRIRYPPVGPYLLASGAILSYLPLV